MAKEDYETPEVDAQEDFSAASTLTAGATPEVDLDAAARAEDAGVVDVAFVDYDKALKRYEARSDVETLEQRRARENGTEFKHADNLRELGEVNGVVTTKAVAEGKDSQVNVPADKVEARKAAK